MIELTKHIEILLLENDCVIVPGLGGFIAHHQPAHYEEAEGMFIPPMRTVGFNPQLTMNDGLLAQAIMQTCHTDFPDAVRKIEEKVEELKETLYTEGAVEMTGIGILHYTMHQTYEFHPQPGGLLAPTLYALDSFSISPLSAEIVEAPIEQDIYEPVLPEQKKKEFRLKPQWLGNAVAVAVAVVLFFLSSVPVENTYIDKGNYASLGTDCLFDAIRSHSMVTALPLSAIEEVPQQQYKNVVPVAVKVEKVAPASKPTVTASPVEKPVVKEVSKTKETAAPKMAEAPKKKETPKPEVKKTTPKPVVSSAPKKHYHIIVASLTTSSDAQRTLKEYKQQGHTGATVKEGSGRFRISLCSFADRADANRKLNELKKTDAFKGAWILTSK